MSTLEKNGKRPKTGGRTVGTRNKKTAAVLEAIEKSGMTPLDYMLSVMRNENNDPRERLNAAMGAAPYVHAKLASVEVSGPNKGPIVVAASTLDEML